MKTQFELALILMIKGRRIPVLGINTGAQMINIAYSGTLRQLKHQHLPLHEVCHQTEIFRHSKLYACTRPVKDVEDNSDSANFDACLIKTNSYHECVIDKVGDSLSVNAKAKDGAIEGVEATDLPFCIGVQWNAEFLINSMDSALFNAFIKAASLEKQH
jgi:putative glutamine amidotransferase